MFNWKHYHLFKCACKNHTKYKTYTLSTRIVARLVISYSKYNFPKVILMYQKMSLDAYRNSFLRVFSVIIEIINYPFKFGKCSSSAHFFFKFPDPPSIFSPRCARWIASLEKRPKLRHCQWYSGDQFYWKETSVPDESYRPAVSHWKHLSHIVGWSNLM